MKAGLSIILLSLCCISLRAFAAEKLTVTELLDRYTANQDKIQKSFIIKSEVSSVYSGIVFGGTLRADKLKEYGACELRFDGARTSYCFYRWGQIDASKKQFIPRNEASYYSTLWDGQKYFHYQTHASSGDSVGTVTIYQKPKEEQTKGLISFDYCGHEVFGFLYGEYKRVDSILRKVATLYVRKTLEKVNGSDCYVINAITKGGKYTLWIDPQHGYNIAKAQVFWGENVPPYGIPHWRVKNAFNSISDVCFKEIDDLWVPVEAEIVLNRSWHNGEWTKQTWHHRLTDIILNPDHDVLESFIPNDIKNGAKIRILNSEEKYLEEEYTWQDSMKFVPDQWDGHIKYVPKDWSIQVGVDKPLPRFEGIRLNFPNEQTKDKAILLCFFDINQRPSRNCIKQLTQKAAALEEKGIAVVTVQASEVDEDKLIEWTKTNNIHFPVGAITADIEKTRFTWGVRSLPWLILTDKQHTVIAEGLTLAELDEKLSSSSKR